MTEDQVRQLPLGLYRVYWLSGGMSVAAVGMDSAGNHWLAPTNWSLSRGSDLTAYWSGVDSIELITTQADEIAKCKRARDK